MKKGKKQKQSILYCPYCGSKKIMTFKDIYGDDASSPNEKIWVCSNFEDGCDAYVRTHRERLRFGKCFE